MRSIKKRVQSATRSLIGSPIGGRYSFSKRTPGGRRNRARAAAQVRELRARKRSRAKQPGAHLSARHLRGVESIYGL